MSQEQNKKTLRHFQCRDYLWEVFEQMSSELECSPDYLINEAMRQYARSRNYGTKSSSGSAASAAVAKPAPIKVEAPVAPPPIAKPVAPPAPPPAPVVPPLAKPKVTHEFAKTGAYPAASPSMMAPPTGAGAPTGYPKAPSSAGAMAAPSLRPSTPSAPPPFPRGSSAGQVPAAGASGGAQPPLYVEFNGERYTVTKDEFIIGRSSKTADLAIKDGNVSRRHAAISFRGGRYFIMDLGSTNGIEYGGERIESKPIEEGDVVIICDYELKFSYR